MLSERQALPDWLNGICRSQSDRRVNMVSSIGIALFGGALPSCFRALQRRWLYAQLEGKEQLKSKIRLRDLTEVGR